MVELVDTIVSKTIGFGLVGSSPTFSIGIYNEGNDHRIYRFRPMDEQPPVKFALVKTIWVRQQNMLGAVVVTCHYLLNMVGEAAPLIDSAVNPHF